jgi:hypothetical protein
MAYKTLVAKPSKLVKQVLAFLQGMTEQKGEFTLAMLVPSETGLLDKWNLALSAPWIDRGGLQATIPTITSSLLKHLTTANAHKLERVSVLPTSDQFVVSMSGFSIPLGEVYLVRYSPQINGAIVLVAEPTGTARGRPYHPEPARA